MARFHPPVSLLPPQMKVGDKAWTDRANLAPCDPYSFSLNFVFPYLGVLPRSLLYFSTLKELRPKENVVFRLLHLLALGQAGPGLWI